MLDFYASFYAIVVRELATMTSLLAIEVADGHGNRPLVSLRGAYAEPLKAVADGLSELPVSPSLRAKAQRYLDRSADPRVSIAEAQILFRELNNDLIIDLASHWFLMIPAESRELYRQTEPAFGQEVADQFPSASKDIAAAARCVALDEWTAAVFHLMRVLEDGVHELASWLAVPLAKGAGEQWKNALDQIEKAIREMEKHSPSPSKTADLTFYSGVVAQFRWFKDAWRNHVSHARAHYDAREARQVWDHVQPFMQELARHKAAMS